MELRHIVLATASLALVGCITKPPPNTGTTLHQSTYANNWKITGVGYTPNSLVDIHVNGAPVQCGNSYCPNTAWEMIGSAVTRPLGMPYPGAIDTTLTVSGASIWRNANRIAPPRCKPRNLWNISFMAKDTTTSKFAMRPPRPAEDIPVSVTPFFAGLPDCRE